MRSDWLSPNAGRVTKRLLRAAVERNHVDVIDSVHLVLASASDVRCVGSLSTDRHLQIGRSSVSHGNLCGTKRLTLSRRILELVEGARVNQ